MSENRFEESPERSASPEGYEPPAIFEVGASHKLTLGGGLPVPDDAFGSKKKIITVTG